MASRHEDSDAIDEGANAELNDLRVHGAQGCACWKDQSVYRRLQKSFPELQLAMCCLRQKLMFLGLPELLTVSRLVSLMF